MIKRKTSATTTILIVGIIAAAVLAGRLRALPKVEDTDSYSPDASVTSPQTASSALAFPKAPGAEPVTNSTRTATATDGSDVVQQLLADVTRTYETGSLPVRIRLQDQLSRYWDENPPSAEELVGLIGDRSLPAELRTYLARTFANRVKMRAYSDEEKAAAFAELREMVAAENEDSLLRADLANVLTTIDDSDAAVETVAGLLDDTNPQAVHKAVTALTHTMNPLAVEAAYVFVQDHERLLKENPAALLTALAPLSTTDNDVTPMLNGVIRNTDDFKLYAGAVQCLIHAKPTVAVLETIAQAYLESTRFPQNAAQAKQMCRAAAIRHRDFFSTNENQLNQQPVMVIEGLISQ